MGTEMNVVDLLETYQVEAGDYVRFLSNGKIREGFVLEIEDKGETFVFTLSDDVEGDSESYEIPADSDVALMMYSAVAV